MIVTDQGAESSSRKRLEHIPGQMLISVREDAVLPHLPATGVSFAAATAKTLPEAVEDPLKYLRANAGLKAIKPVFSTQGRRLAGARVSAWNRQRLAAISSVAHSESEELRGIVMAEMAPTKMTEATLKKLRASRAIEFVERMPARWLAASRTADPNLNLQWGLRATRWFSARRPDASSIKVAVLDTGVDTTHSELGDTISHYDHGEYDKRDIVGHGTHVAGIVAAIPNDTAGIAGVAKCQLAVWKIFPDETYYGEFYVDGEHYLRALRAVADEGVAVVNLSIGGTARSQTEQILFRRLAARGLTVVAAMGNEFELGNPTSYPAAYDGVLAVGAVQETLARASFSNTGTHIGLAAPGTNVLSTLPMRTALPHRAERSYGAWSGTSMATPYVAGAAALVRARFTSLSAADVEDRILRTARKLTEMGSSDRTNEFGAGLLNIQKALT